MNKVRTRRHPIYHLVKYTWWVLALWLAGSVFLGVVRGTFGEAAPSPAVSAPSEPAPTARP